jgi:CO dehydrogenase maturation factor
MSYTIAIAGKGGVGKTTLAGLVVLGLIARGRTPVLAVDADPNACLDQTLGVQAAQSVGALREDTGQAVQQGMDKRRFLEMRVAECLLEADDFDLLAMGRPEGPGCYCYANAVLKDVLGQVAGNYPYVVVDNEAGLENISRRLMVEVDALVLTADPSARGLNTVRRLHRLVQEMGIRYGRLAVVVNRLRGEPTPAARELAHELGADVLVGLPESDELRDIDEAGRSLAELDDQSQLAAGVHRLLANLGL